MRARWSPLQGGCVAVHMANAADASALEGSLLHVKRARWRGILIALVPLLGIAALAISCLRAAPLIARLFP